jgi:hypothetical protein
MDLDSFDITKGELAQAFEDVVAFNAGNPSHAPLVAIDTLPGIEFAIAHRLSRLFGFRLHVVTGGARLQGVTDFRAVFLGKEVEHSPLWVCAHELWHILHRNYPEVCESRIAEIWDCLSLSAYENRRRIEDNDVEAKFASFRKKPMARKPPAPREVVEDEVLADVNANIWVTPVFWDKLLEEAELEGEHIRAFTYIRDWLNTQKSLSKRDEILDRPRATDLIANIWIPYLHTNCVRK